MIKQFIILTALNVIGINASYADTVLTSEQQTETVTAHNKWRSAVSVAGLTWSGDLAATAQNWADTLKTTQGCKMVHSKTANVGENLYWASALMYSDGTRKTQTVTSTQVTDSWGNEKADYNYAQNTCAANKVCGHYTQVVWKTTTQVGCGKAICADNSQIWVCQYSPAGNYVGQKPY